MLKASRPRVRTAVRLHSNTKLDEVRVALLDVDGGRGGAAAAELVLSAGVRQVMELDANMRMIVASWLAKLPKQAKQEVAAMAYCAPQRIQASSPPRPAAPGAAPSGPFSPKQASSTSRPPASVASCHSPTVFSSVALTRVRQPTSTASSCTRRRTRSGAAQRGRNGRRRRAGGAVTGIHERKARVERVGVHGHSAGGAARVREERATRDVEAAAKPQR